VEEGKEAMNVKCNQCDKQAMVKYDEQIPLCADCYHKMAQADLMAAQAEHNRLAWLASNLNSSRQQLSDEAGGLIPARLIRIPQPPSGTATEIVKVVSDLTQAILEDRKITAQQKSEIAEQLRFLVSEALANKDRQRVRVVKTVIEAINKSISTSAGLLTIWDRVLPLLKAAFGLQ